MKKIISLLMIIVMTFMFSFMVAENSTVYGDETLKASNVKVEITVNENNTYEITETIDIDFITPHHGIIRTIPLENEIRRADGTKGHNYAYVDNIRCNEDYEYDEEDGYAFIKIGDELISVTGHKQYVLSYLYDIDNDTLRNGDELYLNIIGNEWTYSIENLEVIIHMPKEFDFSKFGASHGAYGTVDYSDIMQKQEGNSIFVNYSKTLEPGEAFTVRCELPEGYFIRKISVLNIVASILSPLLAVVLGLFCRNDYVKYGKPDVVVETVEFYPPEGITPPKMEYVKTSVVGDKSANALLIVLANKGFLTIDDSGKNEYSFTLYNNPTYELSNEEYIYFEGLWSRGKEQPDGTRIVTRDDLEKKFYKTIEEVQDDIRTNSEAVYEPGQRKYSERCAVCGGFTAFLGPFIIMVGNAFRHMHWYHWAGIILSVAAGVYMVGLSASYHRRTKKNNELYGRILGFENFLIYTEKDRLEMLVEENPMYFYDILPYAYALGITDKWIKKFEGMTLEPVRWYRGDDFTYFMYHRFDYISNTASNNPNSSSSGSSGGWSSSSSGGGGFSGGGSGGGGSSGW